MVQFAKDVLECMERFHCVDDESIESSPCEIVQDSDTDNDSEGPRQSYKANRDTVRGFEETTTEHAPTHTTAVGVGESYYQPVLADDSNFPATLTNPNSQNYDVGSHNVDYCLNCLSRSYNGGFSAGQTSATPIDATRDPWLDLLEEPLSDGHRIKQEPSS